MRFFRLIALMTLIFGCSPTSNNPDRIEWTTMGTIAAVQTRGEDTARALAENQRIIRDVFEQIERLLNAHNADSEISKLAKYADDEAVKAADESCRPCYQAAFDLGRISGGAFNPRWRGALTLDLGAIAKGYAVDKAAESVLQNTNKAADCLIDLGGNIKSVIGDWKVGVKNPADEGFAATVILGQGEALATSATYYRGNHIYDGRTNKPVTNKVASVTVLCESAMWADGLSTTLFVLGPEEGCSFMERHCRDLRLKGNVAVLWILETGAKITWGAPRFSKF